MGKKKSKSNQKLYKMRGCSKKTRKNHLGGSADAPLAYTGKPIFSIPNPNLAYTGKGGKPVNINAANPVYPNTGPIPKSNTVFNSVMPQRGGNCPSCSVPLMSGGCCGSNLPSMIGGEGGTMKSNGFMVGGKTHRTECKCGECKKMRNTINMSGGNSGIPYPNGLVGSPWGSNPSQLPGVDGIPGDRNHYSLNTYNNGDSQTSMIDVGANPPFLGMKAGKRKQKGGTLSNFIGQDFINLGRQFQFGLGSAYNALAGYSSPVNPMPWKGQFPVGAPLYPVKPIV
jgi:hypothetical protein